MKKSKPCQVPGCGLAKSHRTHIFDHEYVPPPREGFGSKRTPLRPRSSKTEEEYARPGGRRERVREAVGNGRRPCQVQSPVCSGHVEGLHEPAKRGRFGGLRSAVEAGGEVPACHACNRWLSQTVEGQRWGAQNGLLLSNRGETARNTLPPRNAPSAGSQRVRPRFKE